MHGPINVKSLNNISEWQMGFNSAFKGLIEIICIRALRTVQYSTVQYSTVQYSTVQYSTVQYRVLYTVQLFVHQHTALPKRQALRLSLYNEVRAVRQH
jgi:hypothetical protein